MKSSEVKQSTGKASGNFSIILTLVLIMLTIGLAFIVYAKSQGIDIKSINVKEFISNILPDKRSVLEKEQEQITELGYDWRERPVFGVLKDYIIKCTRENLLLLDREGKEIWKRSILMEKPLIKTNGSEAVIVDIGGKDIYVLQTKGIKWEAKAGDKIINADISKNGFVSIVEEAKGFKGRVRVFDQLGIEMFNRSIAERFILSAKVSPSSEQLLITGIDLSGISSSSSIEFTDMRGDPFSARVLRENEIFPSTWYMNDDSILALNDSTMIFLDKQRNEKWDKSFKKIYSSNVLLGKYAVVGVENEGKTGGRNLSSEVKLYDVKGNQIANCQIEGEIFNLETYNDIVAVNTVREVYFINSKGKLLGKYSSKSDISEVFFFNRQEVLAVTKNNMIIINLEGG